MTSKLSILTHTSHQRDVHPFTFSAAVIAPLQFQLSNSGWSVRFEYGLRRPMSSTQTFGIPTGPYRTPSLPTLTTSARTMGRYPWAEVLLFEVLHIIVFYPTRRRIYRVVVLATTIYVAAQIYLTPEVTDSLKVTFGVGFTIASHLIFTAYLLFAEGSFPDHWRRVRDEVHTNTDAGDSDKPPSNFPLAKKLWWMIDIAYSVRMIGWVQEQRSSMPPHPQDSRRTFLWKTFLKFIVNTAVTDFMESVYAPSPAFDYRLHDPTDGPETYLAAVPLLRRVPYVLAFGVGVGTGMSAMHNVMALVCVGLCNSSPTLWPDIWGRWRDAYTVRKLWGYVRQ